MKEKANWTRTALLLLAGQLVMEGMELGGLPGEVLVDGRIRYESVSQTGLERSDALTGRIRLGYTVDLAKGLNLLVEGEGTAAADGESYDQYPGSQGTAGHPVVADPENLELNRLQVSWNNEQGGLTVGRQRIIRNNARFIGNVGWRQNEQTYDAAAVNWIPAAGWSLYYAYLDQAMRIFGDRAEVATQRKFAMESHLVEVLWQPVEGAQAGAYAYLLGIENSPADASDTFGIWTDGSRPLPLDGMSWTWRAELAQQSENSKSPDVSQFDLVYLHLAAGLSKAGLGAVTLGCEFLEGDGSRGFSTPLATLHAFNGFADMFLSTPADGLKDYYLKVSAPIGKALTAAAILHQFRAENRSLRLGDEADFVLTWKINQHLSTTAKLAFYDGTEAAPGSASANVSKFWLQIDAKY